MTIAPVSLMEGLEERYQLLRVIGEGGMATVYQAQDRKHDRVVALKVLHDDLAASLGPERFKREIRIAARLQHPHILSVFDSGETAGRLWFTMPYVNGESLRDRLRREGSLPVDVSLAMAREAAQALAYAHKHGVIHRDIKPENILLTEDGSTLVADFGIARSMAENMSGTGLAPGLTQTGSAIGTPMYMAPEQATGEITVDERVDQYALAAVLYEMLTGATPFTGANAAALMAARFTTAVTPICDRRTDVPDGVDTAVRRALSLKATDRFANISEFAHAVAPSISTPAQFRTMAPAARAAAPARGRTTLAISGVALAVVAASGWFVTHKTSAKAADAGPIRIAVLPFQNLGDSTDAYFADGMADELRAKLLKVPGIEVIARASSVQYANSAKTPDQIAKELDVRYVLSGTIRWEKRPDGTSVVHLRPELMQVRDEGPPTSRWQQAFDQPLTDVLTVQARVAEEVATQLQVTLGAGAKTQLAALPTTNAEAYDAYLRAMSEISDNRPAVLRRINANLERAVALDAGFAEAWSRLATSRALLFSNTAPIPSLAAQVKLAAEHAESSAPGGVAGHLAWSSYYTVVAVDLVRAERELRAAQQLEPNNVTVLLRLGQVLVGQGRFTDAVPLLESAARLDPVNFRPSLFLTEAYRLSRRYPDALRAITRARAIAPTIPTAVVAEVGAYASLGDLTGARAAIRAAYTSIAPEALDVYLSTIYDYGWILDDAAQQRVLGAPVSAFDDLPAQKSIIEAQILRARGDIAASKARAKEAMPGFAAAARQSPNDPQWPLFEAFAAGLAGQPDIARARMTDAQRIIARIPPRLSDASYYAEVRARIHVLNGDYDKAFDEIEAILSGPGLLARGHLKLDPMWAPLRSLPRYQRIMSMEPVPVSR